MTVGHFAELLDMPAAGSRTERGETVRYPGRCLSGQGLAQWDVLGKKVLIAGGVGLVVNFMSGKERTGRMTSHDGCPVWRVVVVLR
ncbi:hypothetical protein JCM19368_08290 [Halomonas shantousis]